MLEVLKTVVKCCFHLKISNHFGSGRQQTSPPLLKIPNILSDTHTSHDLILHFLCLLLEPTILCLPYRISNSSSHGNVTLQILMTLKMQPLLKKSISSSCRIAAISLNQFGCQRQSSSSTTSATATNLSCKTFHFS